MREPIEFTVPFVRGKGRPRFTRGGVAYTDVKTKDGERAIKKAFVEAAKAQSPEWDAATPYYGSNPVSVFITTHKPLPKSTPKRVRSAYDTTKPDLDNVQKLVLDGMNKKAFYDDSQVVQITATKRMRTRLLQLETYVRVSPLEASGVVEDGEE